MAEYTVHIFDVDNNGSTIGATEKILKIFAESDEQACQMAENIRQDFNKTEPLPENKEWGKVEWLMHVLKDDEVIL